MAKILHGSDTTNQRAILPRCPICAGGEMETYSAMFGLHVCVCRTCDSTLNVPVQAMEVLRAHVRVTI